MIVYRPLRKVSAVSFDLDDTLFDNKPHILMAESSLREYIRSQYPGAPAVCERTWRKIRTNILSVKPELANDVGKLRRSVLREWFLLAGFAPISAQKASQDCFEYFYQIRSNFVVSEKVRDTLAKLANQYPLAAITNGNVDCERIGIAEFFAVIVRANTEFPAKPDPAMFNYVSGALATACKQILHVGDNLDKDIYGATNAGYQSAWLAVNRPMELGNEECSILPHIQLSNIVELCNIQSQ